MNSARLTIGLLVLAAVLAVAVPTIREGLRYLVVEATLNRPPPYVSAPTMIDAAEHHPDDAQIWLSLAAYLDTLRWMVVRAPSIDGVSSQRTLWSDALLWRSRLAAPTEAQLQAAWERALELGSDRAATHLRFAQHLLPDEAHLPQEPRGEAPPLTDEQRRMLGDAREHLHAALKADPGNGALSYLLAWALMAEGREDDALDALDALATADRWTDYGGELAGGVARLLEESGRRVRVTYVLGQAGATLGRNRALAWALIAVGDDRRHHGDDADAVRCYAAAIRGMDLMATRAPDALTRMDALAVRGICVLSPDWKADVSSRGVERGTEEWDRLWIAYARGLSDYLAGQGRQDLADLYLSARRESERWFAAYHRADDAWEAHLARLWTSPPVPNARAIWWTAAALLPLTVLIGLVALVVRPTAAGATRPGAGTWLGMLMLVLLPVQAWVIWAPMPSPEPRLPDQPSMTQIWEEPVAGVFSPGLAEAARQFGLPAAVATGVWLLAAAVVLARRHGASAAPCALWRLAAATLALVVLLSVLGVWPVQRRVQAIGHEQVRREVVGDIEFLAMAEQPAASEEGERP